MSAPADGDLALAALRALEEGFAHNSAGRPARASACFRAALRRLGPAEGRPPDPSADDGPLAVGATDVAYVRARALLGMVMSDFELRSDVGASLAVLDEAEAWARRAHAPGVEVAVLGQRGLLRMRAGEPRAALRDMDRAVAMIDALAGADRSRLLLNRGSLLLELGQRSRARADLLASAEAAHAAGHAVLELKARHNLGWAEFLAGDLPAALAAMADAAGIADVAQGASPAVALLDRAQVLLEAGLVRDADAMLAQAAAMFAERRLGLDLAQTELARAHVALVAGRPADALRWARAAQRRWTRRHHTAGADRARLTALRAEVALHEEALGAGERRTGTRTGRADVARAAALRRVGARCEELARRSPTALARAALVTAAEAFVLAGALPRARAALDAVGRARGRELSLALQVHLVRARLAAAEGDAARARREVRTGHGVLAEHRRRLGSVEAVTAAAVHGERLAAADVGAALAAGDPAAVLAAVERGRATSAGPARVRPPDDPVLAELLAELRQGMERARALAPGTSSAALEREVARLRTQVRERAWRLGEGTRAPRPVTASAVLRAVRHDGARDGGPRTTVADLVPHGGRLHAVVADAAGLRLTDLAPLDEVDELARRLHADLGVLANPVLPPALRDSVRRSLDRGLAWLDERLVRPLGAADALHVVAGGALVTLPWGLSPSRRGRATSVAPRLALADPADPARAGREDVVVLAGPGLGHARAEAEVVAATWPRARLLVGDDATCAAAAQALRRADVVHLAAHGRHEPDNPLFSWVRLGDGPLLAHELEGAVLPGSLVVLSACEVGRVTVRPGGEVLGLASVLLRLGASAVVAALAPLRDDVAARVVPTLHVHARRGASPAEALAAACSGADEPVPLACFSPLAVPAGRAGAGVREVRRARKGREGDGAGEVRQVRHVPVRERRGAGARGDDAGGEHRGG